MGCLSSKQIGITDISKVAATAGQTTVTDSYLTSALAQCKNASPKPVLVISLGASGLSEEASKKGVFVALTEDNITGEKQEIGRTEVINGQTTFSWVTSIETDFSFEKHQKLKA
mmetsp:Transcript_28335/g.42901  ORF Transcript_28335/g.42901 Transcript_28335/m.42901 type:complete len:114 (+) Transcript_28335:55-396(+)